MDEQEFMNEGLEQAGESAVDVSELDAETMPSNDPEANVPQGGDVPSEEEAHQEPESEVEKPEPVVKRERQVPLSVVTQLRAKNRQLRQQIGEASPAPPAGPKGDVDAEPQALQGLADDDYMNAGQVRSVIAEVQSRAEAREAKIVANTTASQSQAQFEQLAATSEAAVRQNLAPGKVAEGLEFDAVMQFDHDNGVLDQTDVAVIQRSKNPAKTMYDRIIQKSPELFALQVKSNLAGGAKPKGGAPKTSKGETPPAGPTPKGATEDEANLSDEDFLDRIFPADEAEA